MHISSYVGINIIIHGSQCLAPDESEDWDEPELEDEAKEAKSLSELALESEPLDSRSADERRGR